MLLRLPNQLLRFLKSTFIQLSKPAELLVSLNAAPRLIQPPLLLRCNSTIEQTLPIVDDQRLKLLLLQQRLSKFFSFTGIVQHSPC
ncbi:hypothetical protein D3C80_1816650 [compost metagenome]